MIVFDELYELKSELEATLTDYTIDELLNNQRTAALSDLYINVPMLISIGSEKFCTSPARFCLENVH